VFTPDGDYPVINTEKGMLRLTLSRKADFSHIIALDGGTVPNAVPSDAYAVIKGTDVFPESKNITVIKEDDAYRVSYKGTAAHASTPEGGENAVTGLIDYLAGLELDDNEKQMLLTMKKAFIHGDFGGTGCGIAMSDEKSGSLTQVLSMVSYDGKNLKFITDVRYPVTGDKEQIKSKIKNAVSEAGLELTVNIENLPHCVDEDSEFVKTLLGVYEDETGMKGYCKAIGGGTYVHDIEGGVAFGAEFPGDENNMHGNDESISLESLLLNTKIIANAVYRICR
jgi:succinyl-diaminopimelate desuccinylase